MSSSFPKFSYFISVQFSMVPIGSNLQNATALRSLLQSPVTGILSRGWGGGGGGDCSHTSMQIWQLLGWRRWPEALTQLSPGGNQHLSS